MKSIRASIIVFAGAVLLAASPVRGHGEDHDFLGTVGQRSPLPLPSSMSVFDYEERLFDFLNRRQYAVLGWRRDKRVRDTGPYRDGKYYGTHPAVRIYYSPEIIDWLRDGKRRAIPDGAMIIKEQFHPPAARYADMSEQALLEQLSDWTVMVKDAAGSHDGWFWSNPGKGQKPADNSKYPFDHAASGFGMYCIRCHASAKTGGETNEYTFASLRNIEGSPGEPIAFDVDDSWRKEKKEEHGAKDGSSAQEPQEEGAAKANSGIEAVHPRCTGAAHPDQCQPLLDEAFLKVFRTIDRRPRTAIRPLPPMTRDWLPRQPLAAERAQAFVTSTQCMNCHAGLVSPLGQAMFVDIKQADKDEPGGVHLSPYGEWRWTPMGLAGRDPIFYAQLDSEIELLKKEYPNEPKQAERLAAELVDVCLTCHGAMGKHQLAIDRPGELFSLAHIMETPSGAAASPDHSRYGALARDGVSCTICHRMQPRTQPAGDSRHYLEYYLETSITGRINLGPPNELYGPFQDKEIAPYAMDHAVAFTPKHSPYIKSSQLCGSCHVVNLPCIDQPADHRGAVDPLVTAERKSAFKPFHHHIEQATYLEWLNSEFENEFNPDNPQAKTCQDCHMSRGYRNDRLSLALDKIETQIAAIQDHSYPEAENLADRQALEVRRRTEGYARHNFRGLNIFLVEMFNQFDDILGVRKFDFMTGSQEDIPHAIDDFLQQTKNDVAELKLQTQRNSAHELSAAVTIHNKVGHRFPSGVGFRRAFIELLVIERPADKTQPERVLWASGRTNKLGVLVGADGQPLPSEFFTADKHTNEQAYQPHHQVITSQDQAQIYETLLHDAQGRFTTSFIRGSKVVKDNRLLPGGWKAAGPHPALNGPFLKATHPDDQTKQDPRYVNGSGSDEITYRIKLPAGVDPERLTVKATLYYQAIPPYFLQNIFTTAPNSLAVQRLHYLCSNIDLRGKPIEGWKLPIVSATASVK
jgi:hypothetical protein